MTMEHIAKILKNVGLKPSNETGFYELPIRTSKKKTRFFVDNEYFEKGYAAMFPKSTTLIYCVLAKYSHSKKQTCFPAIPTIMREAGIKNRNTAVNTVKILEAYRIVAVKHSKGRKSNEYTLFDPAVWKEPNSITIDTVIRRKNKHQTVSEHQSKQYQNKSPNSITGDTGNHIKKSFNEINHDMNNTSPNDIGRPTLVILKNSYPDSSETEVITAYEKALKAGLSKLEVILKGGLDKFLKKEIPTTP